MLSAPHPQLNVFLLQMCLLGSKKLTIYQRDYGYSLTFDPQLTIHFTTDALSISGQLLLATSIPDSEIPGK